MAKDKEEMYTDAEASRRRDEVVRRMASTPPKPKADAHPKKKKKAAVGRAVRKAPARRED